MSARPPHPAVVRARTPRSWIFARRSVRRRRRGAALLSALVLLATAALLAAALAPAARAIYGPLAGGAGADIVSVDEASDEQGDAPTTDAAISADGRYVVFQTRATNFFADDGVSGGDPDAPGTIREGGIFRYDRLTGELRLVADGSELREGDRSLVFRGAQSPSVSADGRYVAFSSAQRLVAQDTNENVDVYVRDMEVPLGVDRSTSGAYRLVSAKSGGEEPATYAPREPPLPGANPGAEVWPNTAISADGRDVVFRTTELASDLPDRSAIDTPPGNVFVRDTGSQTTTLLSRDQSTGEAAGGAVGPASISADGSTVAWVSTNAPAQTRFLAGESLDASQEYYLWRRWQEAPAPTRRLTGIADPDDPACPPDGQVTQSPVASGPCYGPLTDPESGLSGIAAAAPGLSADGYTVAFLASSALRPDVAKPASLDAFITSMRPGVSRKSATSELTLAATGSSGRALASIESLALSADGSTLAFTSLRDSFVLPTPQPLGAFRPQPTARDLYVIHLGAGTLERAVIGYEGGEPSGSVAGAPTLTADGTAVAFVSAASNLIYGDADGFPDAFTASLQVPAGTAPPPPGVNASEGGFSLAGVAAPELGLSVRRGSAGRLILLVETPGAGRLLARAEGIIAGTGRGRRHAHGVKALLARATATARSEGTTTVVLRLAPRYAKELRRSGRLHAAITVDFTPVSGEALSQQAGASFIAAGGRRAGGGGGRSRSGGASKGGAKHG